MKISLKWLSNYVDVSDYFSKPQDLANILTAAGLEVESIQDLARNFENVVVGIILEKGQHPGADRLTLCQVSTGEGRVHQIVCGATNHRQNDRVVVALPGAVLPGNFAIKRSKIRGVESAGMLCSEKELGLKIESEGILILPPDAPVGVEFAKYKGLDDVLFELKVTPNRADCLSHFGLSREIACLLHKQTEFPMDLLEETGPSTKELVHLKVVDTELCPRYAGRAIKGIKVGPSPDWLKARLEAVGLNSINNVVDVTNFVMMELGQPLHAFDIRNLRGNQIIVQKSTPGEVFTSLDGSDFTLTGEELTIRDQDRPVALAGVVGGKNSGIEEDTTDIFIESAYFLPGAVRRASRKFGIETDSAYRFSRGVNPEAVTLALNRASVLIKKMAGGSICASPYDVYPKPLSRTHINIALSTVSSRLGLDADANKFVDWMKRLGCDIVDGPKMKKSAGTKVSASWSAQAGAHAATQTTSDEDPTWIVSPPMYRWDLNMDMDLVEEFGRLFGYQHIPEHLPAGEFTPAKDDHSFVLERKLRKVLQSERFLQAVNYAFLGAKFQSEILGEVDKLKSTGLHIDSEPVALVNPLNEELGVMRTALFPGLLKNVSHNSRQGNSDGRLFEIGAAHFKQEGSYQQEWRLSCAVWGHVEGLWQKSEQAPSVFELKSAVEAILKAFSIHKFKWQLTPPDSVSDAPKFLHPGQYATLVVEGRSCGFVGSLHPVLKEELKIRESCAIAEFNLGKLLLGQPRVPKYKPISKFPSVERDIALVMPIDLAVQEVESAIRQVGGILLQEVSVFDVFTGGSLEPGMRSVAFHLVFQNPETTLEDAQVNAVRDQIFDSLAKKFSISAR